MKVMAATMALLAALVFAVPSGAAKKPSKPKRDAKGAEKVRADAGSTAALPVPAWGFGGILALAGGGFFLLRTRRAARGAAAAEARRQAEDQRRAADRARRDSSAERRLQRLLESSADILCVVDQDTRVIAWPEAVERVVGATTGELARTSLTAFLPEPQAQATRAALVDLARRPGEACALEWTLRGADGAVRHVEAVLTNRRDDPYLSGYVLNLRDLTARKLKELELRHRAFHDDLTGLANRALVEDRLRHAIARAARSLELHAVVLLALDDFEGIEDAYGEAVAQELLVCVGRRLQARLRPNDTLARMHGAVFGILLEDVPAAEDAQAATRRLIEGLREPFKVAGLEIVIGASAGIEIGDGSLPGSHEEMAAAELAHADVAMRAAVRVGSGSIERYATQMHADVAQRVELRAQIRTGLRRNEFEVHYQPIVKLSTDEVMGYEALARWRHPEHGMISPGDFIPVAEQTGLIMDLGHYVLRTACAQMAAWNKASGESHYVTVNVAAQQLHSECLPERVATVLRGTGLAPELLVLEVTESALVRDTDAAIKRMKDLRDLGVRIAMDDFGTGYSSLSYLRKLPLDILKVDKSFVDEVLEDDELVYAIIGLGRAVGLKVVAEGIEDAAQAERLFGLGCPLGQGYHFGRPRPAELTNHVALAA